MTMANGLELRVPFLDHRLVEFAATLPQSAKLHHGRGKALLREVMRGVLPDAIIDRPKKGFPIPISPWLRGSLRQFTRESLLASGSACRSFFDGQALTRIVEDHERKRSDRSQELWMLLVLEFWHRQFIERGRATSPTLSQSVGCGDLA
jgi:asparagine synthase (glutamine-hydrolysing)